MATSFQALLTDCLVAMGDSLAGTWSRTDVIWPWCLEAIIQFPILRPALKTTTIATASHQLILEADFREVITVEYPLSQDPPVYLIRMNRLDPQFYASDDHYDIDRDYTTGTGWVLWTSKKLPVSAQITVSYLANHKTDYTDSGTSYITVPSEYKNILVAYVLAKGWRERLGFYSLDPTAHMSIIEQMTDMVNKADDHYQQLVKVAQEKLTQSRRSPHMSSDKFDRVY